jgi:hypothetical protein
MRLCRVLVVALAALLATTDALAASQRSTLGLPELPLSGHLAGDGANKARSLRTDKADEERGVWKHVKVRWWLETEKSDEYVKKALKLNDLKGTLLTSNKNYKYYKYFVKKSEEYLRNKWLRNDLTTYQAWEKVGLKNFRSLDDLEKAKTTDAFQVYSRYVNEFDDNVLYTLKAGYRPPALMVSRTAPAAEMRARTEIMAKADRSDYYAKLALGMTETGKPKTVLEGTVLTGHKDYKYFTFFLKEKARLTEAGQLQKRRIS